MLVLILATVCQMPPQAPPLEHRVVILEAKAKTHDKMFDEVQTRLAKLEGVKSTTCPCGVANCQCGCATGGVCRCLEQVKASASTKDHPTYLYPPNTSYTIQGGQVVPSAQPSSMCYIDANGQTVCQNLPQQPVAQPVVQYQQPVMYYRQPMFMAQNCGPRG
jgi:hypothetical protein